MTHQDILTKAIEKAIANGWEPLNLMEMVIAEDPIIYLGEHL